MSAYGEEVRIDEKQGEDVTLNIPAVLLSIHAFNVGGGDIDCRLRSANGHEIALKAPGGGDITVSVGEVEASTILLEA
jgi:hypothetical protein